MAASIDVDLVGHLRNTTHLQASGFYTVIDQLCKEAKLRPEGDLAKKGKI